MDMERTLYTLHKEADHMAFSWYIRKGYVPPVLHKIRDASFKLLNLLPFLQEKTAAFDFVDVIAVGKTLLVGEGNFSFALALTKKRRIDPANIIATTDEMKIDLAPEVMNNTQKLNEAGADVLFGVDATNLGASLGASKFDRGCSS